MSDGFCTDQGSCGVDPYVMTLLKKVLNHKRHKVHNGFLKGSIVLNLSTQLFEKTSCSFVPFVVKRVFAVDSYVM